MKEIPVIITLADRVDLGLLKDRSLSFRRRNLISALRAKADLTQRPLKAFLEANAARRVRDLWIINGKAAILSASAIEKLKMFPGIAAVRLDEIITLSEPLPAGASPAEWNISAVKATDLWSLGFTGQGVVVANMDSGVDVNHHDLVMRYRGGTNSWYDPNGEHATPYDSHSLGHGTGTMGIMVGGDATGSSIGMAPGSQWIAVKIFNDAGEATYSSIHQGFQWLLDPDGDPSTDDAPHVVNNSWGFRTLVDVCYLEFQQDIQTLKTAGIAVVFSAGNEAIYGPASTSISPANNPESFAVGAVDINQIIAGFSSQGPSACVIENDFFPEVVAPGVSIKIADRTFGGVFPINTRYLSGTSFASPHVAGSMALLLEAFPDLSPSELEAALKASAVDLGTTGPDNTYGFGLIDVLAAYRSLVPCTDADTDGYYVEAVCGTAQDCDDDNPDIFPGAEEIKHDTIDQDCNGYDLTIDILSAKYFEGPDRLCVTADSDLGEGADLILDGYGPMNWNSGLQNWEVFVETAGGDPGSVTVTGSEGSDTSNTTVLCSSPCEGDFGSDGDVDGSDLAVFAADFGRTDCPECICTP